MKRKFSFNIPPLKMPSSTTKMTPEPTPSRAPPASSHHMYHSRDSLPLLTSPFISRRPLTPKTEHELRSACALILQEFKPSDHDIPDELKSRLDTKSARRKDHGSATVRVHRPTGAPADLTSAHDTRKHSHNTQEDPILVSTQANTGRRRTEHAEAAQKEHRTRAQSKPPAYVIPSATAIRDLMDAEDTSSLNSPIMSSTESHVNHGSTAPTSAALTSTRSSKSASRQSNNAAAVADAQAAEWMRQELEKRRQQVPPEPPSEHQTPARALSRKRSIRSDLKEYIFPATNSLSRTASKKLSSRESHESLRGRTLSHESRPSGSSHGWRSWGLQHKLSSRSNSRPGTSKGRIENQGQDKKSDLDLNRELPPLPSLDSWKPPEQKEQKEQKENRRSQARAAHIAALMRPQDAQPQGDAAAVRRHHRKSGSDSQAMRYANSNYSKSSTQIARTVSHKKPQLVLSPKHISTLPVLDRAMDFDEMIAAMGNARNFNNQQISHSYNHSTSSNMDMGSPSKSMTSDHGHLGVPHNFSRKISAELSSDDPNYPHAVRIEPTQKGPQKSKLKKVFGAWILKKEKKEDWMEQMEKNGIKTGVMVQDEAAMPPVVRY